MAGARQPSAEVARSVPNRAFFASPCHLPSRHRSRPRRAGFAFNLHERSGKHVFDQMGLGRATHTEEENNIISPEQQSRNARATSLFDDDDVRKEVLGGTPPRSPLARVGARMRRPFGGGGGGSGIPLGRMHSSQI